MDRAHHCTISKVVITNTQFRLQIYDNVATFTHNYITNRYMQLLTTFNITSWYNDSCRRQAPLFSNGMRLNTNLGW